MMDLQDKATVSQPSTVCDLHARLDAALALPPEFGGGFSSHLPMVLQSLHALGADAARLDGFAAAYGRHFEPRVALDPDYAALRQGFARELAEKGRDATLRRVLPVLLQGVATAAFHGAIRTAHAIEAGHDGELAAALAYWSWRWRALPEPLAPAAQRYSFEVWGALLVGEAKGWSASAFSISARMRAAAESPLYARLAQGPWPVPDLLRRLAGLALERYLASGNNFTVLHMVTGLRAVRVLLPHAGEVPGVDAVLARAVVAAYMAAQVVERPRSAPPMDWSQATAAALGQDDDHVIKLIHACREEFAAYGDPRYLEAAALAARTPCV